MKKRLLIIALALSLVFVLSSCGLRDVVGEKDSSGKNDTTQTDDNSSGGSILPDNSTDGDASLEILTGAKVERSLEHVQAPGSFQFMRQGYFCVDNRDSAPGRLVFNRSVSLKDSFKF